MLNEPVIVPKDITAIIRFISNNENFTRIFVLTNNRGHIYFIPNTDNFNGMISVYSIGTWTNQAYRTITFLEPPTGELLTWLQNNGVKQ